MRAQIVGARDYDMVAETGERLTGVSLYLLYEEAGVVGQVAEKRSLRDHKASDFSIPGEYRIEFTPRGRISSIEPYVPAK